MEYLWTTIQVENLEKSIAFYEEALGLHHTRRFSAGPEREIAFMTSSDTETEIELIQMKGFSKSACDAGISLGFGTEDLDEKRQQLAAAGYAPGEIISPNPSTRFFFIQDPDGVQIQIAEV